MQSAIKPANLYIASHPIATGRATPYYATKVIRANQRTDTAPAPGDPATPPQTDPFWGEVVAVILEMGKMKLPAKVFLPTVTSKGQRCKIGLLDPAHHVAERIEYLNGATEAERIEAERILEELKAIGRAVQCKNL